MEDDGSRLLAQRDADEAQRLAAYVPAYAARRLADGACWAQANEEVAPAVLLISDICGFTPLAEGLARRGAVGAEELFRLVNGVFARVADVVAEHGGEIVTFAGDAVIAMWTPGAEGLGAATAAAADCGRAACAAVTAYPAPEPGRLSLRVGIGAGDLRLVLVGGPERRWRFLALGHALSQVRDALGRATPGDVILSAEASALARSAGARSEAAAGSATSSPGDPVPVSIDDRLLEALVPTPILARRGVDGDPWWAELRHVTVVFVGLLGDHAPPLGAIDTFAKALEDAALRYEATLKEVSADDKGMIGILVLGLPPLAHEDDGRRAVLAALDVRSRLARSGLECGVGVAAGRVFCGSIETSTRSDYAVIGDPMNLAARLMQAAGDGVLCDEKTYQLTRARVRYEPRPVIAAKGKAEPVTVWSAVGAASSVRDLPPMIGREAELARLVGRLEALETGSGGLVLIEGDAGIGKSRLASEVVRLARARGITAAAAGGDAIERGSPYQRWRTVFSQICGPELEADPAALRDWVLERLTSERDRNLLPLLESLIPLGLEDNAVTSQMTGSLRAENTNGLVVRLIERAAQMNGSPLLLVLDDAQWLDSLSWMLSERVGQGGRALVVLCKRPWADSDPPPEASFLDGEGAERVRLEGLAGDQVAALVAERVGAQRMSDSVRDFIVERAEGNPFFSQELAYAVRDTGLTVIAGGVFREAPGAGDLRTQELPNTVEAVIMSRVDRLPATVQLTLKVASVAGMTSSVTLLEAVHPVTVARQQALSHLEALAQRDFVVLRRDELARTYSFTHAPIRDVAYNLLLFAQRRDLHAAVAAWYERDDTEDAIRRHVLLAHHWAKAEVPEKAAENLGLAGEQALKAGSYREAVGFFRDALAAGSGVHFVRRASWERRMGEALLGHGRQLEAQERYRRAVAAAGWPEPRSRAGLVLRLISQIVVQVLAALGLRRFFFRTRASVEQNAEAAAGYVRLGETYWLSNESLPLLGASVAALTVAERVGPSTDLARVYATLCVACGGIPQHRLARLYGRRALETAEAVGQLEPLAYCSLVTSVYAIGVGKWAEARTGLDRALEIFDELGDRRGSGSALALLGLAKNAEGDFEAGSRQFGRLRVHGERYGNLHHQVWGLTGEALGAVRQGRADEALRLLQVARTLIAEEPDATEALRVEAVLSLVHLRHGDTDLALQSATAGLRSATARRSVAGVYLLQPYWALSDVVHALWERDKDGPACALARQARRQLHRAGRLFPIGRPRALLNEGLAHWLEGRADAASQSWEAALTAAERLQMPYEMARASYEIGRHLPDAAAARRHLERAAELFEATGAADDVARARGALLGR